MASLAAIRDALQARLIAYYLAGGQAVQVYDTVPGSVVTPAVVVEPASGDYHQTFGSAARVMHTLAVHAMVALGDRAAAQDTLDQMLGVTGALSVKAGIEADRTLGGVVDWCDTQGYRDYGTREFAGTAYLMATLNVTTLSP